MSRPCWSLTRHVRATVPLPFRLLVPLLLLALLLPLLLRLPLGVRSQMAIVGVLPSYDVTTRIGQRAQPHPQPHACTLHCTAQPMVGSSLTEKRVGAAVCVAAAAFRSGRESRTTRHRVAWRRSDRQTDRRCFPSIHTPHPAHFVPTPSYRSHGSLVPLCCAVLAASSIPPGYDIVYGNPVDIVGADYVDPGFRQNIIVQLFDARRVSGSYQEVHTPTTFTHSFTHSLLQPRIRHALPPQPAVR